MEVRRKEKEGKICVSVGGGTILNRIIEEIPQYEHLRRQLRKK